MSPSTGEGDDKVVQFPTTEEERRALRRAKQEVERQRLVNLFVDETAGDRALFRNPAGECYADLIIEGVRQTWPIRSKTFRAEYVRFLRRQFEHMTDESAPLAVTFGPALKKSDINAAIDEFELQATCSQVQREVYVRVASEADHLYIDLGDPKWHAVRITGSDWTLVQSPPVRFRHTSGMQALPFPERGTPIDALRPFLNIRESEFALVVGYLLHALQPRGPYPILVAYGEQGTAKTGFVRLLRSLVDPHEVATAPLPHGGRDLFIAAHNSHIQAFENISKLPDLMADHLCRLSTGAGFRIRTLFTDRDETLLSGARPIMMEGIANFVTRADLLDRSVILALEPLVSRKTERELQADFERQRPGIFGALLDLLVTGVRQLPETQLQNPPRMADFATWAVASGLEGFEAAYAANRQAAVDVILAHDVLTQAIQALVRHQWQGTCSELLDALGPVGVKNPKALSDELRRLAPMLRSVGIEVTHEKRTATRREVRIARIVTQ
jgi:hypothetical protein